MYAGPDTLMQEESPVRGFQSSVDYVLDFGLGLHDLADSLVVEWPDGRVSTTRRVALDRLVTVRQADREWHADVMQLSDFIEWSEAFRSAPAKGGRLGSLNVRPTVEAVVAPLALDCEARCINAEERAKALSQCGVASFSCSCNPDGTVSYSFTCFKCPV